MKSLTRFVPPETTMPSSLSLHDALPILMNGTILASSTVELPTTRTSATISPGPGCWPASHAQGAIAATATAATAQSVHERSEEHTSELQSPYDLVCRRQLENKPKGRHIH